MTFQKRSTPTRRLVALLLSWAVLPVPGGAGPAPARATQAAAESAPAADPRWPELPRLADEAARRGAASALPPAAVPAPPQPTAVTAGQPAVEVETPAGPAVVISSPHDDTWTREAVVEVSGTVVSPNPDPVPVVECRVGEAKKGLPAVVKDGQFSCRPKLAEGENVVVVLARQAQAESRAELRLRLDTKAPVVKRLSPSDALLVSSEPLTIEGEVEDAGPVTVRAGGQETAVQDGAFRLSGVPVTGGPDVQVTVELEDAAGNRTERKLSLRLDGQPPTVAIASPQDGELLRGGEVEAHGTVSDATPVTVQVNGLSAALECGAEGQKRAVADPFESEAGSRYYGGACTWRARVPVSGGEATLAVVARDGAGNEARAEVAVRTDSQAPQILLQSGWPEFTAESSLSVTGQVVDDGEVRLTLDGRPVAVKDGSFATTVSLGREGTQGFRLVATDAAGNTSEKPLSVTVDRQAPQVEIAVPADGAVLAGLPVVVRGTVRDAHPVSVLVNGQEAGLQKGAAWEASLSDLGDGRASLEVIARDAAGNESRATRQVRLDASAPELQLSGPRGGLLTREGRVRVSGLVKDDAAPRVRVAGREASLSWGQGQGTFEAEAELREGDNVLVVEAEDAAGRVATARAVVTRDSTAPLVSLSGPSRLLRSQSGRVSAWVDDASPVRLVVFRVGGRPAASFTQPPYALDLDGGRLGGESLAVEAEATDAAGNVGRSSHTLSLVGSGVVVGQVLDDLTGLPLPGATVRVFAGGEQVATPASDELGRYSAEVQAESVLLRVEKPGYLAVTRELAIQGGLGNVAIDARLTPLSAGQAVDASGATLGAALRVHAPSQPSSAGATATPLEMRVAQGPMTGEQLLRSRQAQVRSSSSGDISVTLPAGALPAGTSVRLTSLSAQGLPGLLPLGWSPVAVLDVTVEGGTALASPAALNVTALEASGTALLVRYEPGLRAWVLAEAGVVVSNGGAAASLPSSGAYALVLADETEPPLAVPAVGQVLPGVPAVVVPPGSSAVGMVEPAIVPPSGGTAVGSVTLATTPVLPSGTAVSAEVRESYALAGGQTAVAETRSQDLLLYRQPLPAGTAGVGATFPMTPSRTFALTELESGLVRVSVKPGREGVRGTVGGSDATQVENGAARLQVPAGALPSNTALSVTPVAVPEHAAQGQGAVALHAALVDLSGQTLLLDAQLSFASDLAQAGDVLVVARLTRVAGVPRPEVVALGALADGRIVSVSHPDLPGVRRGGEYVFYRLASQPGVVTGFTRASGTPVSALVSSTTLPFVGVSAADGRYALVAGVGTNTLTANVPGTSLLGTASVEVAAGATASQDVALDGTLTVAVVRPLDGAQAVPTTVQVEIETTAALEPATVTVQNVRLVKLGDGGGTEPVAVRLVLSASRKLLAVVPEAVLLPEVSYRLEASGLVDVFGAAVSVPLVSWRTRADEAPAYDYTKLVISVPNAEGQVTVSAPAGTFPPGTQVLIINTGNGVVESFTADNQGAVSGQMAATLMDRLFISVSDPFGHQVDFERSQYFDAATGLTAVNAGGGTVSDPEGRVSVAIPEGATDQPVRLKVEVAPLETVPADTPPAFGEDVHVGGVLKLESPDMPSFSKPLAVTFEKPADAPEGAQYQVLRMVRLGSEPDAPVAYEALTEGLVVEEAAPPAPLAPAGERGSTPGRGRTLTNYKVRTFEGELFGALADFGSIVPPAGGAMMPTATAYAVMTWTYYQLQPGTPLPAVVVAKVVRAVPGNTPGQTTYVPVPSAKVTAADLAGTELTPGTLLGQTGADGTIVLWHFRYTGNPVYVTATDPDPLRAGEKKSGQATLLAPADTHSLLRGRYSELFATVVLDPTTPQPPPPTVTARLFTVDGGVRSEVTSGVVIEDTPLLIGLTTKKIPNSTVTYVVPSGGVEIEGETATVVADPTAQNTYLVQASGPGGLYVPGNPGTYVIRVRVQRSDDPDHPVYVSQSFRAIAQGGTVDNDPLNPPQVLSVRTVPRNGATGVPVDTLPQLAFSEPVTQARSNVELVESGDGTVVPLRLIGVGPEGVIEDVTDASVVTGLTVEPLQSLKHGQAYRLRVKTGLVDQDTPPKPLAEQYETTFTTFAPESLPGGSERVAIAGFEVMGDQAYVAHTRYQGGTSGLNQDGYLRTYDISDPIEPGYDQSEDAFIDRPPADLALERVARQAVVVTGPKLAYMYHPDGYYQILSTPSDLQVFDISGAGQPPLVGLISLTAGIDDGMPRRAVALDGKAYVATSRKGIQVVNLAVATDLPDPGTPEAIQMPRRRALGGGGFRLEHVLNIPVRELTDPPNPTAPVVTLNDLKVTDLTVNASLKRVVLATGQKATTGLVVADTELVSVVSQMALPPMTYGDAIAYGVVNGRPLAVVGGFGPGKPGLLQVVDLTGVATGSAPVQIASLDLPARPSDLLIDGTTVIVATYNGSSLGTAYVISLQNPAQPQVVGQIAGVGTRLALTDNRLLLSTMRSYTTMGTGPDGQPLEGLGLKATALDVTPLITSAIPALVAPIPSAPSATGAPLDGPTAAGTTEDVQTLHTVPLNVAVVPQGGSPDMATLQFFLDGAPSGAPVEVQLADGRGSYSLPAGFRKGDNQKASVRITAVTPSGQRSTERHLLMGQVQVLIDANNDTRLGGTASDRERQLEAADWQARAEGSRWAFWTAEPAHKGKLAELEDWAPIKIRSAIDLPPNFVLRLKIFQARWAVAHNVSHGKEYLTGVTDATAPARQLEEVRYYSVESSGAEGLIEIPGSRLRKGDTEFLVKFSSVPKQPVLGLLWDYPGLEVPSAQTAFLAIRPVREWMTFYSSHDRRFPGMVASEFAQLDGTAPVPSDAKRLTLLVHGFNVTEREAQAEEGQLFKRFYWAGHQVIEVQDKAHTVGIVWPGAETPSVVPLTAGDSRALLYTDMAAAQFATNEYRAYQVGVPLARLLARLQAPGRTLDVVAHSLGNIAVNSAIRQSTGGLLRSYVMAEAAVPVEAFVENAVPSDPGLAWTAEQCGMPSDTRWGQQWSDMLAGRPLDADGEPDYRDLGRWQAALLRRNYLAPPADYTSRWSARVNPSSAWSGLFSNAKGARVLNTLNRKDAVVGVVWPAHQEAEKCSAMNADRASVGWVLPNDSGLFSRPRHPSPVSKEALLEQRRVWWPEVADWARIDEWAKLAFWFPAVSRAAGANPVPVGGAVENADLTVLASAAGSRESHSYFLVRPYHEVWKFYETCSAFMEGR